MTEREIWFWLVNANGVGNKRIALLLQHFGNIRAIYEASSKAILQVPGIGERCMEGLLREKAYFKRKYDRLNQLGISFILKEDDIYPEKLRVLPDAPVALYVRGKLPDRDKKCIAVVGARNCSEYGREMAHWFARELSKAGMQVVSGMARGIDGYAHSGAIEGGNPTYAVLGSGIDVCYPEEHSGLYDAMVQHGGVISEYGLGVHALSGQFPMRNRIISGLCEGILVIEAKEKSGSLITADIGLEQGKDIFAVPGRVGDRLSQGCNNLIKMGAYLVEEPADILQNYHYAEDVIKKDWKKNNYMLETKEKIVYANLSYNPKHIDELMLDTKFSLSEIMESLVSLELKGYIKQTMKNFYIVCSD